MRAPSILLLAVWAGVASVAAPTWAQSGAPTVEQAENLRAQGRLRGALELYRAVYAVTPSAKAGLGIAQMEDQLGNAATAHEAYMQLLTSHGGELDKKTLNLVGERLVELDQKTGVVIFEGLPDGAEISVDGRVVATLPIPRPLRLERGAQGLTVTAAGYDPLTRRLTVGREPVTLAGPMVRNNAGKVEIIASTATTEPLTLFVDGKAVGSLPFSGALPLGKHTISARGKSVGSRTEEIVVSAGSTLRQSLTIGSLPADITLDGKSADTEIWVNDMRMAEGRYQAEFQPGRYQVKFRRPGHREQMVEFMAIAGKTMVLIPPRPFVAVPPPTARPSLPPPTPPMPPPESQPAQPDAPPPPPDDDDDGGGDDDDAGFFGSVILPVTFGTSTHAWNDVCPTPTTINFVEPTTNTTVPYTVDGDCSTTAPIGGGLQLRLGYNFGWVGFEFAGLSALDVSTADVTMSEPPPSIPSTYQDLAGTSIYIRPGLGAAGGVRFSTPTSGLRATIGANFGFVSRWVFVAPSNYDAAGKTYLAPVMIVDGGIQLGSVPGGRFYLGALLWWEFAPDVTVERDVSFLGVDNSQVPEPLRRITAYQGTQIFFGPFLGMAFGH